MTELLMQRLADIAEEEDARCKQHSDQSEEEGDHEKPEIIEDQIDIREKLEHSLDSYE